ncbi:hypothetical protein L0Z72_14720, partial [candidate division KSB1 bacterium]|nr:hypothetical protein [candidate division KSB1 bacterium]
MECKEDARRPDTNAIRFLIREITASQKDAPFAMTKWLTTGSRTFGTPRCHCERSLRSEAISSRTRGNGWLPKILRKMTTMV